MTAVTLLPATNPVGVVWEVLCGYNIVVLIFSCWFLASKPGGFVGWEPHSGRKQSCYLFTLSWCERLLNPFTEEGVWCKLSAY